jgi:predicted ATPase
MPEQLLDYESVQLFAERAATLHPAFRLTPHNTLAIAQICHELDGIPLALELAATQVLAFSTEEIAVHLHHRFQFLTSGKRTLPRHRALRASLEWSYDLLSSVEQCLLAQLSVFAGGWTAEGPSIGTEVLPLLTQLVNQSLVVAVERSGHTRYTMLETIRVFALERLAVRDEDEVVRHRHAEYFLRLAEQAQADLHTPAQKSSLDRLNSTCAQHSNGAKAQQTSER